MAEEPTYEIKINETQRQLIVRALGLFVDTQALGADVPASTELTELFESLPDADWLEGPEMHDFTA